MAARTDLIDGGAHRLTRQIDAVTGLLHPLCEQGAETCTRRWRCLVSGTSVCTGIGGRCGADAHNADVTPERLVSE